MARFRLVITEDQLSRLLVVICKQLSSGITGGHLLVSQKWSCAACNRYKQLDSIIDIPAVDGNDGCRDDVFYYQRYNQR